MDFKTIEGATAIFNSVGGLGAENCIFVAFRNTNKDTGFTTVLGGAVGAFAGGMVRGMNESEKFKEAANASAWLVNYTEKGLGIIPLKASGIQLTIKIEKTEPQPDKYVFIPKENIAEIEVKNYALLNKKTQSIKWVFSDGVKLYWAAKIVEKAIPYQEANFTEFMNRFKKK
ncbi:hypothetical protein IKX64_01730 [Candidatus Saccharibacteria bacterium]|nr:hypothetical protein [Candidatus Saccharibacteria bacterium]